jgi:transketolase
VRAADLLAVAGIAAGVLSMPFIKPLDEAVVADAARRCALIVTVEEHSVTGGLGSAVAEVLASLPGGSARLLRCGTTASPALVGNAAYLRAQNGLEAAQLAEAVTQTLGEAGAAHPVRQRHGT